MFRAYLAHHQARQILSIQPLVTIILCWWPSCVQSRLPTCTQLGHQRRMIVIRGCIDTICLSWWWALCARIMERVINKYIERNLCVTLVIYQESLHDARSLKCKKYVKYPLFLLAFSETWIFLTGFRKIFTQMSNLMKILPMGAELFHADRRTDMTKPIIAFRSFANGPKYYGNCFNKIYTAKPMPFWF